MKQHTTASRLSQLVARASLGHRSGIAVALSDGSKVMAMVVTPETQMRQMTATEFLSSPLAYSHELIDGVAVAGAADPDLMAKKQYEHSIIIRRLATRLEQVVVVRGLGTVLLENSPFKVRTRPGGVEDVRKADISVVLGLTDEQVADMDDVTPDLVVEVASRYDRYTQLDSKVAMWLANGVRGVWVLDHNAYAVAHYVDGHRQEFGPADELTTTLLPGFAIKLRELYPRL